MKRLVLALTSLLSLAMLAFAPAAAANPANWTALLSSPYSGSVANSRSFNLVVSVSSTQASDVMTAKVYQDATLLGTFSDDASTSGGSWNQPVSVASDGTYNFKAVVSNSNGDPDKTVQTTVTVDATAPSAPSYLGKTRSGNSYTVKFTAPSTSDVTQVRVFASTSTNFTANGSTQVGVVNVSPNQTVSFVYNALDGNERFFAVQAFDAAGNGSALTGDAVVTAGSVITVSSATTGSHSSTSSSGSSSTSGSSPTTAGQVAGTDSNGTNSGSQDKASTTTGSDTGTTKKRTSWAAVGYTLVALAVLYAGYRWFMDQAEKE